MYKKFRFLLIVVLLVVPMVLAACGGDDDKDDNKSDNKVELSETFTSAAYGVTVKYPKGWAARDGDSGVELANSDEAFAAMDAEDSKGPAAGQAGLVVFAMPMEAMAGMDLKTAFEAMTTSMGSEGATVGTAEEIKVGDAVAYRVSLSEDESEGFVIGFESNGGLVIAAGVAHTGELSQQEATLKAMVDTVSYAAPTAG